MYGIVLRCFFFAFFAISYSFMNAQVQLNMGFSAFGWAVNKSDLFHDPYDELGTYYRNSGFGDLGIGIVLKEKHYLGLEIGVGFNKYDERWNNPFFDTDDQGWFWQGSESSKKSFNHRLGLRYTRSFFSDKKLQPYASIALFRTTDYVWNAIGQRTFSRPSSQEPFETEYRYESFESSFKDQMVNFYRDLRIGLDYHITDRISVMLGLEFSISRINPRFGLTDEDALIKYELAAPFLLTYQF